MIILNEQWFDDWRYEWIQLSYIINWWFDPPIVIFRNYGLAIYGEAHLIYDTQLNYQCVSYSISNKYLAARLNREFEQWVFTSY